MKKYFWYYILCKRKIIIIKIIIMKFIIYVCMKDNKQTIA